MRDSRVYSEMASRCYDLLEDIQVLKDSSSDQEMSCGLVVRGEEVVELGRSGGRSIVERDTVHSIRCIRDVVFAEAVSDW